MHVVWTLLPNGVTAFVHSVGRSVLCGSVQVCVGYVYLLVQKYLGALSELFRILGGEVVAGSAFGTFLFDIGVTL